VKVQSESDFMPARAPYNFSISPTCGFTFIDAGTCFHVEYTLLPALRGLTNTTLLHSVRCHWYFETKFPDFWSKIYGIFPWFLLYFWGTRNEKNLTQI